MSWLTMLVFREEDCSSAQEQPWETLSEEITINLEAPIHLSMLFIPQLMKQEDPAIINVTSALAFVPLAIAPIYSATKAALHSFTLSLTAAVD